MKRNVVGVILGVMCVLGGFMPMAEAGQYFVNIGHVGGLSYLMYPVSIAVVGLWITAIYKPDVRYLRVWIALSALTGAVLAGLSISNGMSLLEFMANTMSGFSMVSGSSAPLKVRAGIGTGGLMSVTAFFGQFLMSLIPDRLAGKPEGA